MLGVTLRASTRGPAGTKRIQLGLNLHLHNPTMNDFASSEKLMLISFFVPRIIKSMIALNETAFIENSLATPIVLIAISGCST